MDCVKGYAMLSDEYKYCIVTDPPYNVGYHYNEYDDDMNEDEYYEMLGFLVQDYSFVMIHYPENLYKLFYHIGKFPEKVVSWVYNSNTRRQHRDIAFCGFKPNFSMVKQPYKNLNDKRIIERIKNGKDGANLYDWWEIQQIKNVSEEKTEHPCQIPYKVMDNIIKLIPDDYVIIDPFVGSGTTIEACIRNGRKYIGFEIDKKYCDIAVDRANGITPNGQTSIFTDFEELK
jgi:DNA modification methylase